ncbi:putative Fe-Mo cluster-binding NifX family protein [Lacrimispora xylanisolvens]|uniref:Putative Fe-Mo cluster-binding NifX family protein n=1 Tax=Lacrimispora xylanisolvens TaxID=384636 RepID=A0A2S6HT63_9FIRM|nr:NifB/NifX family molybdenum-iron cluster-binding protein [Hungatella xylanolytica]PPK80933.1 putative Fe-Mo cluster-binding NifX family protein [Hungatella xylanolytica]
MKIAVTYDRGNVFQHFGQTTQFKIYEVEDQHVISQDVADTNGDGHGALAGFLTRLGVKTLICGGIGAGARNALSEAGIKLYPGVEGNADEAVNSLLSGSLQFDPETQCSHHHEGGEDHDCGHHHHGESCHD